MPTIKKIEDMEINWVEAITDPHFWEAAGEKGAQKQFHVTDEMLTHYYKAAAELLHEQNWADATDAFLFLLFLNPNYATYWLGLGIALQAQSEFFMAHGAYLIAETLDPSIPSVHVNAYQCYMALGEIPLAEWSYQKAMEVCGKNPEFAELKESLIQYKNRLNP